MQPAIHALRAVADSSVKHDGVADNPASLSVPWLAGWAAAWVCSSPLLFTRKLNESSDPTGADRQPSSDVDISGKNFVNAKTMSGHSLASTQGLKTIWSSGANNVRPFRCSAATGVCHRQWLWRIFFRLLSLWASVHGGHPPGGGSQECFLPDCLSSCRPRPPPSKTYSVFVCVGIRQERHFIVYLTGTSVCVGVMKRMTDFNWPKVRS